MGVQRVRNQTDQRPSHRRDLQLALFKFILKKGSVEPNELFLFFTQYDIADYEILTLLTGLTKKGYLGYLKSNKFIVADEPAVIQKILGLRYRLSAEIIHLIKMSKAVLVFNLPVDIDDLKMLLVTSIKSSGTLYNAIFELVQRGYLTHTDNNYKLYKVTDKLKEFFKTYYQLTN